jgi:hypothetical protein
MIGNAYANAIRSPSILLRDIRRSVQLRAARLAPKLSNSGGLNAGRGVQFDHQAIAHSVLSVRPDSSAGAGAPLILAVRLKRVDRSCALGQRNVMLGVHTRATSFIGLSS